MSVSIAFHGAARAVTGSCIHLHAGSTQILIDCGVSQESKYIIPEFTRHVRFDVTQIDALILTHGHLDHSGGYHCSLNMDSKEKFTATTQHVILQKLSGTTHCIMTVLPITNAMLKGLLSTVFLLHIMSDGN